MTKILAALFSAALLFAACGDSDGADTTGVLGDPAPLVDDASSGDDPATSGLAAGSCLAGDPNCDDIGDGSSAAPLPADGDADVTGAPVESVTGLLHIQDGVARLCGSFLESFPVQCGDEIVRVDGITVDNLAEFVDPEDSTVWNEQGVVWVDEPVTLFGVVEDGVLLAG